MMAFYLSYKEVWRNRGRFFLFSLVIALITTLVLFVAALSEGLALANKQYIEQIDAQLMVFQDNVKLSSTASKLEYSLYRTIQNLDGIKDAGPVGFSSGSIVGSDGKQTLDVSLIGVQPGRPGEPNVISGTSLRSTNGSEALIDEQTAKRLNLKVGDRITIKTIQDTKDEFFTFQVSGITTEQQYLYQPSVFIPIRKWDTVRPQVTSTQQANQLFASVIVVKLNDPSQQLQMISNIQARFKNTQAVDLKTAYEAIPGYSAQQSTLSTQQVFVLLIGILIIGGFFQIQMLQKVPQIGVLKAIGASNLTVAVAAVLQIIFVSSFGVLLGGLVTMGLAFGIPSTTPIVFNGSSMVIAVVSLLLIGPLGGLVTIRLAVSVEPLTALGLSSQEIIRGL